MQTKTVTEFTLTHKLTQGVDKIQHVWTQGVGRSCHFSDPACGKPIFPCDVTAREFQTER